MNRLLVLADFRLRHRPLAAVRQRDHDLLALRLVKTLIALPCRPLVLDLLALIGGAHVNSPL